MISAKPRPSSPSRCSSGTNTSSNASSAVSDACQPSFSSVLARHALAALEHQERDRRRGPLAAGADGGDVEVRPHAVGDVRLGAVDEPAAVDPRRRACARRDVRARVRLGDRQRADLLAADRRRRASAPAAPRCRTARSAAWRCAMCAPIPAAVPPEPERASSSATPRRRPSRRPARTSARASRARASGRRPRSGTSAPPPTRRRAAAARPRRTRASRREAPRGAP